MKKRIISLLMIMCIMASLVTALPITASAATSGTCGDNATWVLDESGTLTISGTGDMWDYSFCFNENIKNVVIEDNITSVGSCAFEGCYELANATIGKNVNKIGRSAFIRCTGLKTIIIPNNVTDIGGCAFMDCENLNNIEIGSGVRNIGGYAFVCESLIAINVDNGNTAYSSVDGVLFNKDKTRIIRYPSNKSGTHYSIPDNVKDIEYGSFQGSVNLSSITVPYSVSTIQSWAFDYCNSLNNVYYSGNEEQWNTIEISDGNDCLTNATIHYNFKDTLSDMDRANDGIKVMLNSNKILFDQPPVIIDGRTLVPLRAIFEALGATVEWDDATKTVIAQKDNTKIQITIGDNKLYKNGSPIELDVPAQIVNSRTLVPVRAISEAFGCNVDWNGETKTVSVTTD